MKNYPLGMMFLGMYKIFISCELLAAQLPVGSEF